VGQCKGWRKEARWSVIDAAQRLPVVPDVQRDERRQKLSIAAAISEANTVWPNKRQVFIATPCVRCLVGYLDAIKRPA
jgi:hypothetical protein